MTQPSPEQLQIIEAPLAPLSVIACAGSGKTFTAVRRLIQMCRQLGYYRGRIALWSFSNVAMETFRQVYQSLTRDVPVGVAYDRVEIGTLDSFITGNVLRPHAYRTMGCDRVPFLLTGNEPFLQNRDFKFWAQPAEGKAFPVNPTDLHKVVVDLKAGRPTLYFRSGNTLSPINNGSVVASRLGALGAYTHELGRYWCHRTLEQQPDILRALARRYPHILVDEAQDVGTMHEAIIEQLISAGSQVSLIGDPNQGIYEFAGANGKFLTQYGQRAGVTQLGLTRNYRSAPAILDLANRISKRADTAERAAPETTHGTFFVPYRNADMQNLVTEFQFAVQEAGLKLECSAVLCRGRSMANKLSGNEGAPGQGIVRLLTQAAILRDRHQNYREAFRLVVSGIVGLLADPPHGLATQILQPERYSGNWALRRLVWSFTRDPELGLPAATLTADTQWHPLMREKTLALLTRIAQEHELAIVKNLGNRLARRGLPNAPLIAAADQAANGAARIRVDTVHQAKGESLDAVLYLATKDHARALLAGVDDEVGRIGYVAVTRARNFFWLGIPANAVEELRPALLARGFQDAAIRAQV